MDGHIAAAGFLKTICHMCCSTYCSGHDADACGADGPEPTHEADDVSDHSIDGSEGHGSGDSEGHGTEDGFVVLPEGPVDAAAGPPAVPSTHTYDQMWCDAGLGSSEALDMPDLTVEERLDWVGASMDLEPPKYDELTYQVHDAISNDIIGRIKPMHIGSSSEAMTVYCRLHGCRPPVRRVHVALSRPQMIRWFARGTQIHGLGPNGGREEHMSFWRELLRERDIPGLSFVCVVVIFVFFFMIVFVV